MDKKFLNKVVDQLVSETTIDTGYGGHTLSDYRIYGPFVSHIYRWLPYKYLMDPTLEDFSGFEGHCKGVYGLNTDESEYVWDKWRNIIRGKINNGL
jgi:hypothetical protein